MHSLSRQLRRPAAQLLSAGLKPATANNAFARSPVASAVPNARMLTASAKFQGKVLLVLYDVSIAFFSSSNIWSYPQADTLRTGW